MHQRGGGGGVVLLRPREVKHYQKFSGQLWAGFGSLYLRNDSFGEETVRNLCICRNISSLVKPRTWGVCFGDVRDGSDTLDVGAGGGGGGVLGELSQQEVTQLQEEAVVTTHHQVACKR